MSELRSEFLNELIGIAGRETGVDIAKKRWVQAAMNLVRDNKGSLTQLCRLAGRSRQAYYKGAREKERSVLVNDLIMKEAPRVLITACQRTGPLKIDWKNYFRFGTAATFQQEARNTEE